MSDNSTYFLNEAIKEMTTLFTINYKKTTPYHVQINGLIERVIQTNVWILRKNYNGF